MDEQVKSLLDSACEGFNKITLPEGTDMKGASLGDVVKAELGLFMIYLAMADGTVTQAEATEIHEMMKHVSDGVPADPDGIAQMARLGNIYSKEFESTPAKSLAFAIDVDNGLIEAGHSAMAQMSGILLMLYRTLGDWFIKLDGKASKGAQLSYNTYIKMLEDYRAKNFAGSKYDIFGLVSAEIGALMGDVRINLEVDEADDGTDGAESAAGDDVGDALKGDAGDTAKGGTHKTSKDAPASTTARKGVKAPRKG